MTPRATSAQPLSRSVDDSLPFRFVGGDASLDLVNTCDWTPRGPERDRIGGYDRLLQWAAGAGVIGAEEAARLRRRALARPAEAAAAYEKAIALRWALRRVVTALAEEERTAASLRGPLEELNRFVADAFAHVRLALPAASAGGAGASPTWGWEGDADDLDSILWPIARRAAELIASDEAGRLRVCPGPDCGWVYVDRSRNGLRRWCEMSTCGTDEKTRRRRARAG